VSPAIASPTFYPAPAAERTAPLGTVEHPLPIIVDSDPGLDDALAIALAVARPELDLLAVTTVGGNTDVRHCTDNALRLLELFGRPDIPVAEGADRAMLGPTIRAPEIHGAGGIGDTALGASSVGAVAESAVDLIARVLREHPEPVVLVPVGPLTNIALLLRLHPGLASRIAHVCLMGGSIGDGNTTVAAEFNVYVDPEAAAIVFESGLPITMMGLDVTHQAVLFQPAVDRLRSLSTRSGAVGAELAAYALAREGQWYGTPRMSVHDAVAVAHLAVPDLVSVADYNVRVDTGSGPARGRTVCDGLPRRVERQGRAMNAQVGIGIDRDRFEDLLVEAFASLP
jgi:purine nucleosidase/pyrimidine-specific ribonucleoside hydrolase